MQCSENISHQRSIKHSRNNGPKRPVQLRVAIAIRGHTSIFAGLTLRRGRPVYCNPLLFGVGADVFCKFIRFFSCLLFLHFIYTHLSSHFCNKKNSKLTIWLILISTALNGCEWDLSKVLTYNYSNSQNVTGK